MDRSFSAVLGVGVLSLLVVGCQPSEDRGNGEGDVNEARQAQIPVNPDFDWRRYDFRFEDDTLFAELLVIGDRDVSGYSADTEYWFVDTSNLDNLGELDLEAGYEDGNSTPPALSGDQEFTQPVYLTWQSFSTDPVSDVGELYSNGNHHLRIKLDAGEVYRLTWYQTLTTQNPQNRAPDGTFSAVGGNVSVPSGQYGYCVDAVIE